MRGTVALSSIVLFEMRYGIAESDKTSGERGTSFGLSWYRPSSFCPSSRTTPEEAGYLRAILERAGTPIGPYDTLIAAHARRRKAVFVTANTREFARVPGLNLENWADA